MQPAKVDFVFDKGENHIWLMPKYISDALKPGVLSLLTYYEYFCRKIELVSLFFHPGPR